MDTNNWDDEENSVVDFKKMGTGFKQKINNNRYAIIGFCLAILGQILFAIPLLALFIGILSLICCILSFKKSRENRPFSILGTLWAVGIILYGVIYIISMLS